MSDKLKRLWPRSISVVPNGAVSAAAGFTARLLKGFIVIKLAFIAAVISMLAACSSTSGSQSTSSRDGRANTSTMGAPDNMQNGGPGGGGGGGGGGY
jgi:hypothetical protein